LTAFVVVGGLVEDFLREDGSYQSVPLSAKKTVEVFRCPENEQKLNKLASLKILNLS